MADRFPRQPVSEMTDDQRQAAAEIVAGPRGEVVGPFVPLSRSPELMRRLQRTGEYLRFGSTLDRRLFELCILTVARHWDQDFEWSFHMPLALAAGLPQHVVDAVAQGLPPQDADPDIVAVCDLMAELLTTHFISDEVFEAAKSTVGEAGFIDLVGTAGYYTALAMVMNCARTPPGDGPRLPARAASGPQR